MARKRMIDPQIWMSEDFSKLSHLARLIWIGLFSNADDEGRGRANVSFIKSQLFPFDNELSIKKIENCLQEIENLMSIKFYVVDNKKYYQLLSWGKFQTINRPSQSQIPKMPENTDNLTQKFNEHSLNDNGVVIKNSLTNQQQDSEGSLPKKNININKKEINKEKSTILTDSELYSLIEAEFKDADVCQKFKDYAEMRKAMGKNKAIRTLSTLNSCISKIRKYAKTKEEAIEILDYSIVNCYQGLFDKFGYEKKSVNKEEIPYAN